MKAPFFLLACALALCVAPAPAAASGGETAAAAPREGARDFDFEFGSWQTHVRVRRNPLSGEPADWAEYRGTSLVRSLHGGRANVVELSVSNATGSIEGMSFRLYNPQSRQWSLNYVSLKSGMLTSPVYGSFDSTGKGVFHGQELVDGRAVLVRFLILPQSRSNIRFEQAFSVDGGRSWEDNWIAIDTKQ